MAIIVNDNNKRGGNLINLFIWVIILGVILFSTYLIFFKQPEIADIVIPSKDTFDNIDRLSKITLNPDIIKNPAFEALTTYINLPESGRAGRLNPFLPF
jgi:hypothetical protein